MVLRGNALQQFNDCGVCRSIVGDAQFPVGVALSAHRIDRLLQQGHRRVVHRHQHRNQRRVEHRPDRVPVPRQLLGIGAVVLPDPFLIVIAIVVAAIDSAASQAMDREACPQSLEALAPVDSSRLARQILPVGAAAQSGGGAAHEPHQAEKCTFGFHAAARMSRPRQPKHRRPRRACRWMPKHGRSNPVVRAQGVHLWPCEEPKPMSVVSRSRGSPTTASSTSCQLWQGIARPCGIGAAMPAVPHCSLTPDCPCWR